MTALDSAFDMMYDLSYALHQDLYSGTIDVCGKKYQLSFVISDEALSALLAMSTMYRDLSPGDTRGHLLGIPFSRTSAPDAPPISLVVTPMNPDEDEQ